MQYSSIHNADVSRRYTITLDSEVIARGIPPHHVASIVYDLEQNGINVCDELWDDHNMLVELTSTDLLDGEDAV